MSESDYTRIDEIKLMTKVERYKRRWKEQRHYSEYLKCKLAKKTLLVQELKAESAKWRDTALSLSANCGALGAEIDSLKARLVDYENNGRMEDLQKENERLRKKVALFDSRWEDQNIYHARLVSELAKEKNRNGNLNAHIKGLQTMLDTRCVEIDRLNGGMEDLHTRIEELEAMFGRLVETIESGEHIELFPKPDLIRFQDWYAKMDAIIAEWKERKND